MVHLQRLFLGAEAHDDDEDREWVACIAICASSDAEAQQWGDFLARERNRRFPNDAFIRSSVESAIGATDWSKLPRIRAGQAATDDVIGW